MQIKKILFMALNISFYSAVMGMEKQAKLESKQYVETIAHYMSEKNNGTRKQNILPFAEWITAKRDVYYNDKDWNEFCENNHKLLKFTINAFPIFKFPETLGMTTKDMVDVIMGRAYKLEPNCEPEALTNIIDQDLLVLYHALAKNQNS